MSRTELLEYSISMNSLCEKLLSMEERMTALEGERDIQKRVNELLKERADQSDKKLIEMEKSVIDNSQYLRRRQLEISNVPEAIENKDLTKTMAEFLSETGEKVDAGDIDKCHRLKKNTTVIMEFKTRTVRDSVLMARSKLKNKRVRVEEMGLGKSFINESLCHDYRKIDYICRRLKRSELIKDTWYFNGKLFVIDWNDKKHQIRHLTDTYIFCSPEAIGAYLK